MSNSLVSTLSSLLDHHAISSLASRIGTSEESVSRGLPPTFAAILGAIASRSNESGPLRQIFDLISGAPEDSLSMTNINSFVSGNTLTSPLMDMGQRLLSTLFGNNQSAVGETIGRASGLGSGAATQLMAVAAPLVAGFLGKRVRDEGLGLSGFSNLLQRESADINSYLPSGLSNLWSTSVETGKTAARAVAVPVEQTASRFSRRLFPILAAIGACLLIYWFAQRGNRAARVASDVAAETGTRARVAVAGLGDFVVRQLPGDIRLNVPEHGVEVRLIENLQGNPIDTATWFDFDRLTFAPGSATLRPGSEEQLRNIASIMNAYPTSRLKIGGYTDNTGAPASNLNLSRERAEAVKAELIGMGIGGNRLESEGYGEQHPVADNATEEGRTRNRRISMRILQK